MRWVFVLKNTGTSALYQLLCRLLLSLSSPTTTHSKIDTIRLFCYHPDIMAKTCATCGKGSKTAGGYSNRTRATKFNPTGTVRRQPNLQWATKQNGTRVEICTRCLKANKHLT